MEKITKEISLYNISDLQETATVELNGQIQLGANLRVHGTLTKRPFQKIIGLEICVNGFKIKDEKPKARCGYFSVNIPIKGWTYDEEVEVYSIDITEAICKLTGDTYRKDGTIKVGSSSSQGWSFSGHLEDRIMRSI